MAIRKISVLLEVEEFKRFQRYCRQQGFKQSTLAARLIREYLKKEGAPDPAVPVVRQTTPHFAKHAKRKAD